jgi:hypothetical protein
MWVNEKLKEPLSDKDAQKSLDRKNDELAVLNNEDAGANKLKRQPRQWRRQSMT